MVNHHCKEESAAKDYRHKEKKGKKPQLCAKLGVRFLSVRVLCEFLHYSINVVLLWNLVANSAPVPTSLQGIVFLPASFSLEGVTLCFDHRHRTARASFSQQKAKTSV